MTNRETGPPGAEQRSRGGGFAETYASVLRFIERRFHPSHAEDAARGACASPRRAGRMPLGASPAAYGRRLSAVPGTRATLWGW